MYWKTANECGRANRQLITVVGLRRKSGNKTSGRLCAKIASRKVKSNFDFRQSTFEEAEISWKNAKQVIGPTEIRKMLTISDRERPLKKPVAFEKGRYHSWLLAKAMRLSRINRRGSNHFDDAEGYMNSYQTIPTKIRCYTSILLTYSGTALIGYALAQVVFRYISFRAVWQRYFSLFVDHITFGHLHYQSGPKKAQIGETVPWSRDWQDRPQKKEPLTMGGLMNHCAESLTYLFAFAICKQHLFILFCWSPRFGWSHWLWMITFE